MYDKRRHTDCARFVGKPEVIRFIRHAARWWRFFTIPRLRRPTRSRGRTRKKASACSARNDSLTWALQAVSQSTRPALSAERVGGSAHFSKLWIEREVGVLDGRGGVCRRRGRGGKSQSSFVGEKAALRPLPLICDRAAALQKPYRWRRRQRINRAQLLTDHSAHCGVDTKQRSSIFFDAKEAH
jgi:hypothetical protein